MKSCVGIKLKLNLNIQVYGPQAKREGGGKWAGVITTPTHLIYCRPTIMFFFKWELAVQIKGKFQKKNKFMFILLKTTITNLLL